MNITKKAGCIVLDVNNKTIALVYREKQNDYSFSKGHREGNETLIECAIRETAEETKENEHQDSRKTSNELQGQFYETVTF